MMPGPSSALSRGACGYHLKQEPKVFSLLISQYPATVPTDRAKQEDHRQGSLEYVVGRLSVQVPLLSLPMWRLRHVSYCTYGRVGAWIQAVCTAFTLGSSLDVSGGRIFLLVDEHLKWVFLVSFAYLPLTFPLVSLEHLSSGHHWFCSQPVGRFRLLFLLDFPLAFNP